MLAEEFLKSVSSCTQEINIASLTLKLEHSLVSLSEPGRRCDGDLVISLDLLGKQQELLGCDQGSQLGIRRNVEIRFKRDVIQEHGSRDRDLRLRSEDGHEIRGGLFVREVHRRVGLGFDIVNEDGLFAEQSAMIAARD